jgi:hypothetical protein
VKISPESFRGSAPLIFPPSFRWASQSVAASRSDLEKGGHAWPAQFGPVRVSSAQFDQKNKSESMGHIRKIVPVAGATQGCGQIETGLRAVLSVAAPPKEETIAAKA